MIETQLGDHRGVAHMVRLPHWFRGLLRPGYDLWLVLDLLAQEETLLVLQSQGRKVLGVLMEAPWAILRDVVVTRRFGTSDCYLSAELVPGGGVLPPQEVVVQLDKRPGSLRTPDVLALLQGCCDEGVVVCAL